MIMTRSATPVHSVEQLVIANSGRCKFVFVVNIVVVICIVVIVVVSVVVIIIIVFIIVVSVVIIVIIRASSGRCKVSFSCCCYLC